MALAQGSSEGGQGEGSGAPATNDARRARGAGPEGEAATTRSVSPKRATVRIAASPGVVEVSDEGPGIAAEEIPRAFERFHLRARAGHASPDGAGLGLAIVRELSEAMDGSAAVENLPAQGARFTIRLPA